MLIDLIVALGFAFPSTINALAAYRRASAAVIWAKRRHPKNDSATNQSTSSMG